MDYSNIFLSISGFLIVMLLGIIGFFLRQQIGVIKSLTDSVNSLNTSLAVVRSNETHFRSTCVVTHSKVDDLLTKHGERLDQHEIAITTLQVTKNINK